MAPYTYSNSNYYDPVGIQPSQPQGYACANTQQQQSSSSSSQHPSQSYQDNYNQSYNNPYANPQYASTGQQQQQSSSSNSRAASAVNTLNNHNYSQSTSDSRSSNVAAQYDNAYYGSAGLSAMNDRSHSNNSPPYAANTSGSTFGRQSLPNQSQTNSNNFAKTQAYPPSSAPNANTKLGYQNSPPSASYGLSSNQDLHAAPQSQQQQPQMYASPLHAVQAQQDHTKQTSRHSSNATSPQIATRNSQQQSQQQRQQTAPVEPTQTTVDPSQVYDMRAETQRKAQADVEKRRKAEATKKLEEKAQAAEAARKKAEEDKRAEEERKKREAEGTANTAEEDAKRKAAQEWNEQRRKAREEKRQSKTAATTLTQIASSSGMDATAAMMREYSNSPNNDEEAEMRAMFKKMRDFNAKNPAMLAKLWEEERTRHTARSASPLQSAYPAPPAPPKQTRKQPQNQARKQPVSDPPPAAAVPQVLPTGQQQPKPMPTPATKAPPQPVAQQASTALWPPHKKSSLAEAAATWLNNLPENVVLKRTISKEEILKMLDTNPSYVQLCESIEKICIRFERSALAKELLKAVPDGLRSGQIGAKGPTPPTPVTGPAAQSNDMALSADAASAKKKTRKAMKDGPRSYGVPTQHPDYGPVSYEAPTFSFPTDATQELNSMTTISALPQGMGTVASAFTAGTSAQQFTQSPYIDKEAIPIHDNHPVSRFGDGTNTVDSYGHSGLANEVKAKAPAQPAESPRPPADKEEAARKRTFGDLVDLTTNDDSDDDYPPRKIQQLLGGPVNGTVKHPPPNEQLRPPPSHSEFWRQNPGPGPLPGQGQMLSPGPARPWVFNASQKPPTPIVPIEPQPPARPKGPTEEQKQQDRIRGKMLVEPIMRDRVARKSNYDSRTIARDVLLATGRHPDMRSLNAHLNSMQKLLGDHGGVVEGAGNKSDLSTIRWDIIDPGGPRRDAKDKAKTVDAVHGDETAGIDTMDDEPTFTADPLSSQHARGNHQDLRREKMRNSKKIAHGTAREYQQRGTNAGFEPAKRKRGRPSKNSGDVARPSPNNNARSTTLEASATPATPTMSSAVGYSAFRQYDENGNVVKKKGRPVGWRKNLHSREAAGLTPIKSGGSSAKPAPSQLRPSEEFITPSYPVFTCRWRNCAAELDSLARLRKHVLKLHGAASRDGLHECQWKSCRSVGMHVDAEARVTSNDEGVASFATLDHWMNHVNKEHIEEVAWELGDGPKGGAVSEIQTDSDLYLSDAYGRSVTPIIVPLSEMQQLDKKYDADEPIHKSGLPQPKRIGRPPKEPVYRLDGTAMTKEERDATHELEKLKTQKLREGISMGREGSRLAIEKRRLGFLDDENFEDLVYDSD